MGSEISQQDFDSYAVELYETTLQHPRLLPDIGIEESLLKYSGTNSPAELSKYSNDVLQTLPSAIEKLGSVLGPMTLCPNAVGLGALVISVILELFVKGSTQTGANSYSMLQRIFGEEKASSVRDTMSEYVRRHRIFINNGSRLQEEIRRLEVQLSNHLTILRNSLLYDRQMGSRGFKIWVNGAFFHLQMLIHEARLSTQTGKSESDYLHAINAAIDVYMTDLDHLLEEYKNHKIRTHFITYDLGKCYASYSLVACAPTKCIITSDDKRYEFNFYQINQSGHCGNSRLMETYMNHVFSKYEPVSSLKRQFANIKNNLIFLINQHDSFTLPSAGRFPLGLDLQ